MEEDVPTMEEMLEYITQTRGKDSTLLNPVKEEMDHRFNKWVIAERKRVAAFAMEKERNKNVAVLQNTIDTCENSDTCEECDITRYRISLIIGP